MNTPNIIHDGINCKCLRSWTHMFLSSLLGGLSIFQMTIRSIGCQSLVFNRISDGKMVKALKCLIFKTQEVMYGVIEKTSDSGSTPQSMRFSFKIQHLSNHSACMDCTPLSHDAQNVASNYLTTISNRRRNRASQQVSVTSMVWIKHMAWWLRLRPAEHPSYFFKKNIDSSNNTLDILYIVAYLIYTYKMYGLSEYHFLNWRAMRCS